MFFFFTPPVFHWFFANVHARSPLTSIIWVFGHMGRDLLRIGITRGPRRTAHYVRSKVERSRACAPLTKKTVWDSGYFTHVLFLPKKRKVMGFFWQCKRYNKNPGFLDFGFCQCKWAYYLKGQHVTVMYTFLVKTRSSIKMKLCWYFTQRVSLCTPFMSA